MKKNLRKIANEYRHRAWMPRHTAEAWHSWQAYRTEEYALAQQLKSLGLTFTESQEVFRLICEAQSKTQRRLVRAVDPLALPVTGKAYLCDGQVFGSKSIAKRHARKVARHTQRLTYQNMLSGSYMPLVTVVLVRG